MSHALGAALALALALPWAAQAAPRPRYGGEARVVLPGAAATRDPARAAGPSDLVLARASQATLVEADEGGALRPGLLEELPRPEDDGRTWRLRLLPGLRFHDGAPLGAAEVAASLARLSGPGATHAWLVSAVEGSAEVRQGRATALAGVQVTGERELRVTLGYPLRDFPAALAALPAAVVRAVPGAVLGAGPFRPAGPGRLAAFDGCAAGRPFLDGLVLTAPDSRGGRALRGGADAALRAEPLEEAPRAETAPLGLLFAVVSPRLGPGAAPTRAVLAALDRADLARFGRAGAVPLQALLPGAVFPALAGPAAPVPGASPADAPRRLRVLLPSGPDAPRGVAARLQVKLYDAGVRAALEEISPALLFGRLASGDYEVALVPVWLLSRAPVLGLAQVASALGGPEAGARALARAAAAPDDAALARVAGSLAAELLAVPLQASGLRLAVRDALAGAALRPDGTLDLADAWLAAPAPLPPGAPPAPAPSASPAASSAPAAPPAGGLP